MHEFVTLFPPDISSFFNVSPSISLVEIVHINSVGGAIINLFAAYSAYGRISVSTDTSY